MRNCIEAAWVRLARPSTALFLRFLPFLSCHHVYGSLRLCSPRGPCSCEAPRRTGSALDWFLVLSHSKQQKKATHRDTRRSCTAEGHLYLSGGSMGRYISSTDLGAVKGASQLGDKKDKIPSCQCLKGCLLSSSHLKSRNEAFIDPGRMSHQKWQQCKLPCQPPPQVLEPGPLKVPEPCPPPPSQQKCPPAQRPSCQQECLPKRK
ncbi:uncharacterized protein LOC104875962 isoform X1 [Fukomys damarensis]|uniref:uncharacterized protein LOC104875962 isoform X1 n=1 Tax=Fukomys damarensis TaxID=885580 RepID=UPI00053F3157|nr:uncharacterized protein LOC104875962 isoform X1 [Fukomys damarensis]XP_033614218.1 uncharacterized protein LOC104875962 isoform X1 [Fukomys damarensis]